MVIKSQSDEHPSRRNLAPKWDGREVFTIEEAGEILGISRGSAYSAARKGALPVISIGRLKRVPRGPFEKLLGIG
jgi:excisionase family DNA binding protein